MYYSKIQQYDVSNGSGIGCTIFFSGCRLRCKGCHNPQTWSFTHGQEFTKEEQDRFIFLCQDPHVDHISLSGGDFMQQEYNCAIEFIKRLKSEVVKPIWVWTGLTIKELNDDQLELLSYIDVLIDGRFVEELKDLRLKWRGSSNQRVISVKETLEKGEIVLYKD